MAGVKCESITRTSPSAAIDSATRRRSAGTSSWPSPAGFTCAKWNACHSSMRRECRNRHATCRGITQAYFRNAHMECGLSRAQGLLAPLFAGFGFGGGSAPAVVDVCVATHMRGLVPHDRVCEMRSGADLWGRAWPPMGAAHSVLSGRSSRRCAGALSSPSRWWWRYSIVASAQSARRVRGRRRPRRSCGACLGPRARASVRGACGRCGRLGLARRGTCLCVCFPACGSSVTGGGGARRPRSEAGARASCRSW